MMGFLRNGLFRIDEEAFYQFQLHFMAINNRME